MRETNATQSSVPENLNGTGNRVIGLPLIQSLLSPNQVFPTVMNRFTLQALMASSAAVSREAYNAEIFAQNWPPNTDYVEPQHIVSSSDQAKTPAKRGRKKKESIVPAPLSPPVSASSPLSNASSSDAVSNNSKNGGDNPKPPPGARAYVCKTCNRSFGYKHVLQNHERTHTGEKPFKCPQCSKQFTRDHHLKTHMRLHTGERPFHCEHCDKHFVQVANLRRHIRVHTGERPYACRTCSSRFSDSNQLKAHMLIHSGKKPFECDQCHGQFRRRHHLNHHKCGGKSKNNTKNGKYKTEEYEEEMESDSDSKHTSDDTLSNDSISVAPSYRDHVRNNIYHQPWLSDIRPSLLTIPPRNPSPMPEALNLSSANVITFPVQTEPEDLSMNRKHRSANNNNSSGSNMGSPRSVSPVDVEDHFS